MLKTSLFNKFCQLYTRRLTTFTDFPAVPGIFIFVVCCMHSGSVSRLGRWIWGFRMLLGEQWELLSLHEWYSAEFGWNDRVLWEKEFNAANHHRRDHRQGVSTVHSEWLVQRDTEQICLDWCSYQRNWRLVLEQWTTIRLYLHTVIEYTLKLTQ